MARTGAVPAEIMAYAAAHSTQPDDVLARLIEVTTEKAGPFAGMQIGPDQGAFMSVLAATLRPRFAVEVGTFTGYSSICVARGLADGGRLLCCDVSDEWTAIAREHWELAGLTERIELRLGPAVDTLRRLPAEPLIDLAFIDADKPAYTDYYEEILPRLSPQGVILVDNTLWSGNVLADSGADDENTLALRSFNDHVAADHRVDVAQLTVGDGVTMIRRR